MRNEILLIGSLMLVYGGVLLWYRLFGRSGLYGWTVFATIAANIEVLILIDAFGMEQTLGNILFASTFLVTDILSEVEGKKAANRAVNLGILTSVCFIVISQLWLLYRPAPTTLSSPTYRRYFPILQGLCWWDYWFTQWCRSWTYGCIIAGGRLPINDLETIENSYG